MSSAIATEQNGVTTKHRACDECRSRKLACTKEADGCSRCKRDGIVCHFSLQKPMGRPRKRPRDESDKTTTQNQEVNKAPMIQVSPDTQDPGLAFLNFLTSGKLDFDASLPTDVPENPNSNMQPDKAEWGFGYTGNDFGELSFDMSTDHTPSFSSSNLDPALFISADSPPQGIPRLSSGTSTSPSSSGSPPNLGPTNCACTASLYLAIDSMQKLSNDITAAVRQARLAGKSAYDVVNCPSCSMPTEPPIAAPTVTPRTMQNFQNLMLLATLIPSVVHAYERILTLVDQEVAKAKAERREITFALNGYGGWWGADDNDLCGASTIYNNKNMEPAMWRLTVRALLRVDVYGLSGEDCSDPSTPATPFHLGLKDIVIQMENRSKARHAIMDHMIETGAWTESSCALKLHKTGETPTCQRIIQIARLSIDNLVIA